MARGRADGRAGGRRGCEGASRRAAGARKARLLAVLLGPGRFGTPVSLKTGLRLASGHTRVEGRERARATGSGRVKKRRATRRAAVRASARLTAFGFVMPPLPCH